MVTTTRALIKVRDTTPTTAHGFEGHVDRSQPVSATFGMLGRTRAQRRWNDSRDRVALRGPSSRMPEPDSTRRRDHFWISQSHESSMALRLATAICVARVAITYVTQLARFSPPLPVMSSRHLRRELVLA